MSRVTRWAVMLVVVVLLGLAGSARAVDNPLTKAAKAGDLAAARKLIAARADVNVRDGDGSTALLWAAYNSDLEMARALIAGGARFDTANNYGVTPLLQASRTGDVAMMKLLVEAGADPRKAHPEGETPLMGASRAGRVEAVSLLVSRGVDVNTQDSFQKQTALMWAAAEGHTAVVDTLLKAGADPNLTAHLTSLTERKNADHPTGGFTALMWAARNGHVPAVRRLVEGGANLNLRNGDGATAMIITIVNDRFDVAATLLELGADANDGSLYHAVEMRDATTDWYARDGSQLRANHPNKNTALDLVKLLLNRGADPNKAFVGTLHSTSMPNNDNANASPFYRAAVAADVESLQLMIERGADVEWSPPQTEGRGGRGNANAGRTPLMVAMTGGRGVGLQAGPGYSREGPPPFREPSNREPAEALKLLLKAGASANAIASDGTPLLHQAAQANNLDMIRALVEARAILDMPNRDGLTALEVTEARASQGARGGRGAAPPAGGGRGRGGNTTTPQEVAALLRQLMGLPPVPAPVVPAAPVDAEKPGGNAQ